MDEKLGPVAVSIKREKLEDHKDHGPQYQYRIIFRTREVSPITRYFYIDNRRSRLCALALRQVLWEACPLPHPVSSSQQPHEYSPVRPPLYRRERKGHV